MKNCSDFVIIALKVGNKINKNMINNPNILNSLIKQG